jgi:divalent metal cation (Fe/Co/Zn/Cd) transporter
MTFTHANALLYATLCGSLCFVVAFMYQRKGAKYKFIPSLVAFAIAAKSGVEWIGVMGSILLYGYWPSISPVTTIVLAILLVLAIKVRGNVARILDRLTFVRPTN